MIGASAQAAIDSMADDDYDDGDYEDGDEGDYDDDEIQHGYGGEDMEQINVWDAYGSAGALSHSATPQYISTAEKNAIMADAIAMNSFREAAIKHGIDGIDLLFPEAHNYDRTPEWLNQPTEWVDTLLNAVSKAPFFRLRTTVADITFDEARALGYITGNRKKDEMFKILKRTVKAQTIYKRQKLDRDTILEVTDFDLVPWLEQEMRGKLREEIARAILIGDGRDYDSEDKIHEDCIIPIAKDHDFFTIKGTIAISASDDIRTQREAIIEAAVTARVKFRGAASPTLYTPPSILSQLMLSKDTIGRRLYDSESSLATAMRVGKIVECSVLENHMIDNRLVAGVILNPSDYVLGTAKGGEITKFSDFDIDFNQYKYLIETRSSGMLRKPYSAIVLLFPEGVTPRWYTNEGMEYITIDASAAMTEGGNVKIDYFVAHPVEKDNPRMNGWFERSGAGTDASPYTYTGTTDVVPDADKTYFVRSVTVPNRN